MEPNPWIELRFAVSPFAFELRSLKVGVMPLADKKTKFGRVEFFAVPKFGGKTLRLISTLKSLEKKLLDVFLVNKRSSDTRYNKDSVAKDGE